MLYDIKVLISPAVPSDVVFLGVRTPGREGDLCYSGIILMNTVHDVTRSTCSSYIRRV